MLLTGARPRGVIGCTPPSLLSASRVFAGHLGVSLEWKESSCPAEVGITDACLVSSHIALGLQILERPTSDLPISWER